MAELTRKHKLALARYRKILSIVGLDEQELLNRAADDPEAIVPVLDLMIDQVVRSEVITTYTWIDSILDDVLTERIAGTRKGGIGPKRRKTLELVLNRLYPLQKLAIIRTFKKVPKQITSSIGAIDELRNGLAHSFLLIPCQSIVEHIKVETFLPQQVSSFCGQKHAKSWHISIQFCGSTYKFTLNHILHRTPNSGRL